MTDDDQTALNIANANEKLWFQKMVEAQRERDEAKARAADLKRDLDQIEADYKDLTDKHRRLETEFQRQETRLEIAAILRHHLDPFLPEDLQDAERRAANPMLYENVKSRFTRF